MAARPGSVWVEGNYLHYIAEAGAEYRGLGDDLGAKAGARPGSLWIEGEYLMYIDESTHKRQLPRLVVGASPGRTGSVWVEGNWIHILNETPQEATVHADAVHEDWGDHADEHGDGTEHDNYADEGYADWSEHTDSHENTLAHDDIAHADNPVPVVN